MSRSNSLQLSDFFVKFHKKFKIKFKKIKFDHPKTYEQFKLPHDADTEKLRRIMSLAFSSDLGTGTGPSEADVVNREIYYLRAFYATVFLTQPSNHIFLSRHNSSFLSALFD